MSEQPPTQITGTHRCYRIESALNIDADIDTVWSTATQSETLGWWFAPGTIEGEGGRIQLNFPDGAFGMVGTVKVLFRPHVIEFTWHAHELSDETIIRFDFVPTGEAKTTATVTSFVFADLDTACFVLATWQFMLERLQQAVVTKTAVPDNSARVAELTEDLRRQYQV